MKQPARRLLRYVGRATAGTAPVDEAPETVVDHDGDASRSAASRYDKLDVQEVLEHLDDLGASELASLAHHERANRNRVTVLAHIDARLGNEPWPGYDALDVDGVRFGLDGADRDRFITVLAYERAHRNRAGVVLAAQQRGHRGGA
jgi:hypothetical protein